MLSLILLDLSLGEVLADIPFDIGAIVVYLLFAVFIGMTWAGSRNRSPGRRDPEAP